jgi:hypothetical protein
MNKLNVYISKSYKNALDNIDLSFLLNDKTKINIIYHYNYNNKEYLDLVIRHSSRYTFDYLQIFYKNMVFINNFFNKYLLADIYKYSNDLTLFPFTFVLHKYDKSIIKSYIDIYNDKYNNNDINKYYLNNLWIVRSTYTYNFIDILVLTTEELLNYKNNNIYIQKYLERPLIINNKKHTILTYLILMPKVIFKDNKYIIKTINNKIKYKIYLHKHIIGRHTINDYQYNNTNLSNISTMSIFQDYFQDHHYKLIDDKIFNLVYDSVNKLRKIKKFRKIINKSIANYPYFSQLFSIEFDIDQDKNYIYIDRITTTHGIEYNHFKSTTILKSFYQKLIKLIYKIKFNKLISYDNKVTNDLILIKNK